MNAEELGALLGITESSAYDLIAKGHFEKVDVLGKMRISNESFWKWYSTQSIYRTVEDRAKMLRKWKPHCVCRRLRQCLESIEIRFTTS